MKNNIHLNCPIKKIKATALSIPTQKTESDGTLKWHSTTIIIVEINAEDKKGIGYTYSHSSAAHLINDKFSPLLLQKNALNVKNCWELMKNSVRNLGAAGISSCAISAVDTALWDLKARILDIPLVQLFDQIHASVPIYGSGGFTSYSNKELQTQFAHWKSMGINKFKMKIGRHPQKDMQRIQDAREVIGDKCELFVDANGAFNVKEALFFAEKMQKYGVTWFEEPVSSDNLSGLNYLRDRAPAEMEISAGEYGYDLYYFQKMLQAKAVDVLQADCTRCGGYTGFKKINHLCEGYFINLSSHTAPQLHLPITLSSSSIRHMEYFYDHVRIENMLFDGVILPIDGNLSPDLSKSGHGLDFKWNEAKQFMQ